MKKKKILITGAAGYLGSIISTKLVELGHICDWCRYNQSMIKIHYRIYFIL